MLGSLWSIFFTYDYNNWFIIYMNSIYLWASKLCLMYDIRRWRRYWSSEGNRTMCSEIYGKAMDNRVFVLYRSSSDLLHTPHSKTMPHQVSATAKRSTALSIDVHWLLMPYVIHLVFNQNLFFGLTTFELNVLALLIIFYLFIRLFFLESDITFKRKAKTTSFLVSSTETKKFQSFVVSLLSRSVDGETVRFDSSTSD